MNGTIVIPNKNLFKMNEVCSITGVKPYVLRFWETEFEEIDPTVSESGQKLFSHSDIEVIILIKKLLFEDKKTIAAAKNELMLSYAVELNPEQLPTLPNISDEPELTEGQNRQFVGQQLQSYDIDKLVMAKEKLGHLLSSIDNLKERHQWS